VVRRKPPRPRSSLCHQVYIDLPYAESPISPEERKRTPQLFEEHSNIKMENGKLQK